MRNNLTVLLVSLGVVALGVWMLFQPSVAGYTGDRAAYWSSIIGGAAAIVLGALSAALPGPGKTLWRTIGRAVPSLAVVAIGVYGTVAAFTEYYSDIGRVETFSIMAVSMGLLVLGLFDTRSRLTEYLEVSAPSWGPSSERTPRPHHA